MLPRPRFRLPLWSAVAIVGAAYLIRSLVHGSLRPDMPLDLIVLAMVVAVVAIVGFVRAEESREREHARDDTALSAEGEPLAEDDSGPTGD